MNGGDEEDGEADDQESLKRDSMDNLESSRKDQMIKNPSLPGLENFPLYLSNGQKAFLYIPTKISQRDFDRLKRQIEHSLLVVEDTFITDDETPNQ